MAVIGIKLVPEVSRLIKEIDVPGERVDSSNLHITLLYLGQGINIKLISKVMISAYDIAQSLSPFRLKIGCIKSFDPTLEGNPFPIIAPIQSERLQDINAKLKSNLDDMNVKYDKTFPDYHPHITLSMNENGIKKTKIQPIEWVVQEMMIWSGSNGDNKMSITFPLALKENENIVVEDN